MKKVLGWFGGAAILLLAVIAVNSIRATSSQIEVQATDVSTFDADRLGEALSRTIQHATVSHRDPGRMSPAAFRNLHDELARTFPRVHDALDRDIVAGQSLLYRWEGTDSDAEPILLLAHLDVVPVEGDTEADWTHPPFQGRIADGYVWGRGAMDVKMSVICILAAVERLLEEGFDPGTTLYLAFGHNEEVGGDGAPTIAALLESRGVRLSYVLDEGLAITHGIIPGVSSPVALVGIAEKGGASLELSLTTGGGHSAMPPDHTAAGQLGRAVARLEENPFPAELAGPTRLMFETLAPEMGYPLRALFTNIWLFKPLIEKQLTARVSTNAAIRTTTAVTMLQSGVQDNVIPALAGATVNFRIVPGETVNGVVEHVRAALDNPEIQVEVLPDSRDPSPVSSTTASEFHALARTIREVFPGVLVAPALVLGGTDSRHFTGLSSNVYRFVPLRVGPDDLNRLHGTDERIALDNLLEIARFYRQLIRNTTG